MAKILELPWIPLLSLLVIVPLIVWQVRAYIKEKQKNRTPKIPQIDLQSQKTKNNDVKNVTLISNLKNKTKNSKKTSLVFSITIVTFVIINVFIVTFYLDNRKISYLPRATDSVSPTLTTLNPLDQSNLPSPTLVATPTSTEPTLTEIVKITQAPISPTVKPTLMAQAYNVPTYAPSPTPTRLPTKTVTITKSETTIPVVGIDRFSVILGVISLFFLVLGIIL